MSITSASPLPSIGPRWAQSSAPTIRASSSSCRWSRKVSSLANRLQLPWLGAGAAGALGFRHRKSRRRSRCGVAQAEVLRADEAQKLVPGLRLYPDFLSAEEGEALASYLDGQPPSWRKEQFGVPTLYNVKHFGVLGSLRPRLVRLPDPSRGEVDLPQDGILGEVAERLGKKGQPWSGFLKSFKPNEANVNDYRRSECSKLLMHWDDRGLYEEAVCSVSVLGECVMTFRPSGRSNFKSSEADGPGDVDDAVRLAVPARSLLVLKGAARYEWQHGIPEAEDLLTERRVAIIFRRVRGAPVAPALEAEGTSEKARPSIPKRAMVISTNWPDADVSAAGRVTNLRLQMLRQWMGQGSLTFASPARPGNSQGKLSANHDVKCIRIKTNDEASVLSALEAAGQPELVIFDGFNAEERFAHYVRAALPGSMRVLDMQDFHALRLGRERLVAAGSDADVATYLPAAGDADLQRELAAMHRCDAVWAISRQEQQLLVETYGMPSWKVCAAPFGFQAPEAVPDFEHRGEDAMFIGNWRHRPNRDCARWLIKEVWPLVRQEMPEAELNVYGANQTPEDAALHDPSNGAQVRGYCRSVAGVMKRHKLLVAPLRYGAGVKGKVLEAMLHGPVVVTTPVGVEGIAKVEAFPGYVVQEQDAASFAHVVVQALRDRERWEVLQKQASALMARDFDEQQVKNKLRDFLQTRWTNMREDRARDYVGQMLWHSSVRSTELMAKYLSTKEENRQLKAGSQGDGK